MKGKVQYLPIDQLSELDKNPRYIKEVDFETLCQSLIDNPDYFEARPIIVSNRTGQNVIIAGNQRFKAASHIGLKKVPVYIMEGLTQEKERELVIRDNVSNGHWDWDMLANDNWNEQDLREWGLDVPFVDLDVDFDEPVEKEKEQSTDPSEGDMPQLCIIMLEYTEDEHAQVKDALSKLSATPEGAIWDMLLAKGLVEERE
jgi:hypothetical protein